MTIELGAGFDQRALEMALRTDMVSFNQKVLSTISPATPYLDNWHIAAVAWQLQQALAGKIQRLIICLPPRSMKSIISSVTLPAWALGHDPTRKIISVTYSNALAAKYANDFRLVVGSPWYRPLFPNTRISRHKDTEIETAFTAGGFRLGTSTTGTLTGRGGDLIICDDPIKAQDVWSETKREVNNELFRNTILSRLDNKQTGAIIVVMQRLHANDFVGSLLDASDDWTVLSLSAIAERDEHIQIGEEEYYYRKTGEPLHAEREPLSVLHRIRHEMGPDAWAAQYQQDPVPAGGLIIKRDWIKTHNIRTLEPNRRHRIFQSWDTAGKVGPRNSFSVCTTWLLENGNYYLLDLIRGRFDFDMLESTAVDYARKYRPYRILIEDASTGLALAAHLREGRPLCRGTRPCSSRQNHSAVSSAGQIRIRPSLSARKRAFSSAAFEGAFVVSAIENNRSGRQHSQALAYQGSTYTLDNIR